MMEIARVTAADLDELTPLMVAYCDFYESAPGEPALRALAKALIADPAREGLQLLARVERRAVGFATVLWSWSTSSASRIGVMNDLFVSPEARGHGVADALIGASLDEARTHGAAHLEWLTQPDNRRARAVYERVGAQAGAWVEYSLDAR